LVIRNDCDETAGDKPEEGKGSAKPCVAKVVGSNPITPTLSPPRTFGTRRFAISSTNGSIIDFEIVLVQITLSPHLLVLGILSA
jgi:hypothetical protein